MLAVFIAAASAAEFTPAQTIPDIRLEGDLATWIENLYPARTWHAPEPQNYMGLAFGTFSGLGALGTVWLPVCQDAGYELPASFYAAYAVINNPGFTLAEKIILPIPDYAQFVVTLYYIWVCMAKPGMAYVVSDVVQITKLVQTIFLPYISIMTYQNGPQHDAFTAGFTFMNAIFNLVDVAWYYIYNYSDLHFHI